jgi:hypothetical protein
LSNQRDSGPIYQRPWQADPAGPSAAARRAISPVSWLRSRDRPAVNSGNAGRTYPVKWTLKNSIHTNRGTSLLYTGNQYVYNWAAAAQAGCYIFTLTLDTNQAFSAYFNLK